jgi:hypothetical protein
MVEGCSRGRIEVAYATAEVQTVVALALEDGMTARLAVERSGLLLQHPEIADGPLVLGIYGVGVDENRLLCDGDRVEITRPLIQDPRDMRRDGVIGRRAGTPPKP